MRKSLLSVIVLFACCWISPVAADEHGLQGYPGITEAPYFEELPLVLSVTRLQQPMKDVPGFVTVIDAETIRHSGARDLAELLRGVPGFQVAFNAYGAPVAGYHGMTNDVPKGLQVLIDGRTQYSVMNEGGVGWNTIDISLEEIERIEVLRGSNSPAFGSNAFMGVVNVVTKHTAETRGLLAKVGNGNQGIRDRYARFGFGGDFWSARISAELVRDDGEPDFYDSRETERYNLSFDTDLTDGNSLRFDAGIAQVSLGVGYTPGAGEVSQITNPQRARMLESSFIQLAARRHFGAAGDTQFKAYRVRQQMDDFYNISIFGLATDFNNSGHSVRHDVELQHTADFHALRLVAGLGWREDVAEHVYLFGRGREVSQQIERAFGQIEWRPNKYVTANFSATAEHSSLTGDSVTPRAAINFHAAPMHTFKLIAGRSQRLPTLYELKADERVYETVGAVVPVGTLLNVSKSSTGMLKPEEVFSREIGYFGEFPSLGLTLDARWFHESLKNRIQSYSIDYQSDSPDCPVFEQSEGSPCGNYDDFFNVIDADIRGWETQINWRPTKSTHLGLTHTQTSIDTHWTSSTRALGAHEQATLDYLARSSPSHSTSLSIRQRLLERFTLVAAYYKIGSFKWTQNGQTDDYHRFDWRLAYDFSIAAAKAELAWTVRNEGSDHAEWWSRRTDGDASGAELIGTRHFLTLRVDY